ncbi:hypothetical protein ACS386_11475 [Flavobacteriaceae bacterium LMO-SS05]
MKKLSLLFLLVVTAQIAIAQNSTIAKFKYEEAEQAFVNNDYKQAISKLDEAETLLGSTNPKLLHLKISAQFKLIEEKPYDDFKIIESAKKLSTNYLKDYESLSGNEDKYRDIYIIAEYLKTLPNTIQDFNNKRKEKLAEDESKKANEILSKQKADENFKNFVFYTDFKIGLTLEETYKLYPAFKKNYKFKDTSGFTIAAKDNPNDYQPTGLFVKNNIIYGYYINFYSIKVDDDNYKAGTTTVNKILDRLNNEFQFNPVQATSESTTNVSGDSFYTKVISYTWSKNDKTIILSFSQSKHMGENLSSVSIHSKDESLTK